jgi:hypothetical protein
MYNGRILVATDGSELSAKAVADRCRAWRAPLGCSLVRIHRDAGLSLRGHWRVERRGRLRSPGQGRCGGCRAPGGGRRAPRRLPASNARLQCAKTMSRTARSSALPKGTVAD